MRTILRPALVILGLLTLITGLIYPLVITGVAQVAFLHQANGSLIERDGKIIASALIGQSFINPRYLWGRPSATSPVAYNGAASGGSNLGPSNPALHQVVTDRIAVLRASSPDPHQPIPVDLVTSSGSGLDPHISSAAAAYQAPRIAQARKLPLARVQQIILEHTEGRTWGILGEPRVNVVGVNLALDRQNH